MNFDIFIFGCREKKYQTKKWQIAKKMNHKINKRMEQKMNSKIDSNSNKTRLAKFISNAGYCSRRNAEILIDQERVQVNNAIVKTPVYFVNEKDFIEIDGQQLKKQKTAIWLYYKPVKVITSHKDNKHPDEDKNRGENGASVKYHRNYKNNIDNTDLKNHRDNSTVDHDKKKKNHDRKTVFNEVKKHIKQHVISVGRLDYMSEGLLILTNDPKIAHFFERPENKISRTYLVITHSKLPEFSISKMKNQVKIDGVIYKNVIVSQVDFTKAENMQNVVESVENVESPRNIPNMGNRENMESVESLDNRRSTYKIYKNFLSEKNFYCRQTIKNIKNGKYIVYEVVLTEGKNREIRKIFSHFQAKIAKLIRFSYGNFSLLMNSKMQDDRDDSYSKHYEFRFSHENSRFSHEKYIQPNQVSKQSMSHSHIENHSPLIENI